VVATGTGALERQRLAAHDFLHLHTISERYIELADYYQYKGPSQKEINEKENPTLFDSALLPGKERHETQEPREAYCVLALGEEGCPPAVATKAPVAGTTTSSASAPFLTVNPGGLPTHYFVEYGTTTAYGHTTSSAALPNDSGAQSETVALSGLEPCTTYHYQAEAESSADEDEPALGGDRTFTTECEYSGTVTIEYTETPERFSEGGLESFGISLPPDTEKEETEYTYYGETEYYTDRKKITFSPRLPISTKFSSVKATLLSGPGEILQVGELEEIGFGLFREEWDILTGAKEGVVLPFPIPPTTWVIGIEAK
jgi:hypothetical protein